ncbi:MAG: S8 family serine peptidase [Ruminococcaceae bacterium]|nr:S8 family serine peptidase [Oscillospiraceae bacterium]
MKRILSILLTIVILLSLAGCDLAKLLKPDGEGGKPKPKKEDYSISACKEPDPDDVIRSKNFGVIPVNQIIVMFGEDVDKDTRTKTLLSIKGRVVGGLEVIGLYQIEVDTNTEEELISAMGEIEKFEGVESVFPNKAVYTVDVVEGTPCTPLDDPVFSNPAAARAYNQIGMENAWKIIKSLSGDLNKVTVGVLDTAFYTGSDEFGERSKVKLTGDTTEYPRTNEDGTLRTGGLTHGTMVAHIIGANSENGGVTGIASVLGEKLEINVKNIFTGKSPAARKPDDDTEDKPDGEPDGEPDGSQQGRQKGFPVELPGGFPGSTPGDTQDDSPFDFSDGFSIELPEDFPVELPIDLPDEDEVDITQVRGKDGRTYTLSTLVRLKEQVESGADVINCSFGPEKPQDSNEEECEAYKKFFEHMNEKHPDVVFVAAAGNEADENKEKGALNGKNYFPGGINSPNLITVGALNNDGTRAQFSNFGTDDGEVTLSSLGVSVVLGYGDDKKPVMSSGTSYTAPQVTAAIALLKSLKPNLSAEELKELLKETSAKGVHNKKPGEEDSDDNLTPIPDGMGAGVLRVDKAVLKVINMIREENNQPPLSMEQALRYSSVDLVAEGEGSEYTITAQIPSTLSGAVDVKIEVFGQYILNGDTVQQVEEGGSASWQLKFTEESIYIVVTRLDSNTCSTLTLEAVKAPTLAELEGVYDDGVLQLKDVYTSEQFLADLASGDDSGTGCDLEILNSLKESIGESEACPFAIYAQSETEGIMLLSDDEGDDLSFTYNPANGIMTFNSRHVENSLVVGELTASYNDDETHVSVAGTLRWTAQGVSEDDFYFDFGFTGSKPLQ